MKRFVTLVAALIVSAPLIADEQKPAAKPAPAPAPAQAAPAATPTSDSPMVAAAKSTKRTGKKVVVITNDTLTKEGTGNAHITTSKTVRDIQVPPEDPSLDSARQKQEQDRQDKERFANEKAKKAKDAAAADQKMRAASAQQELDGPYGDDPAMNEKILEEMAKRKAEQQQPQPTQDKPEKPPM